MSRSEWTSAEIDVVAQATIQAPSVHNTQPWSLELDDHTALLRSKQSSLVPFQDPDGTDHAMSCGAAVTNMEIALRFLGYSVNTSLFPAKERDDVIARVTATERLPPNTTELNRYHAIARRRSYRSRFDSRQVPDSAAYQLVSTAKQPEVDAHLITSSVENQIVADALEYGARVAQNDKGYQRELAIWTVRDATRRYGAGIARHVLSAQPLPWAGIVRRSTGIPDRNMLADRLARETLLIFTSTGASRRDNVQVGMSMQQTWLAAVGGGFVAAVVTQPFHLSEVRSSLQAKLGLSGVPRLLMRVGYPRQLIAQSPHKPSANLFTHK